MAHNEKFTELELLERQMRQIVDIANTATQKIDKDLAKVEKRYQKIITFQEKYIDNQNIMRLKEQKKYYTMLLAAVSGWTIITVFMVFWFIGE